MEISGVYEAARSEGGDLPVIVIRGLSDSIGFKRDARWTEYAYQSAAAFCKALLLSGVLKLKQDSAAGGPGHRIFRNVRHFQAHFRDWYSVEPDCPGAWDCRFEAACLEE
jgi:hypothetical protein